MSVNQCTPDTNLPSTIPAANTVIPREITALRRRFFILLRSYITAAGITHITSMVVEEG